MIDHLKQDQWFVDVRGEVSGPISSWDIIQKLIAGELKVIHRVSQDRANWKGICNEEYFENAVNLAIDFYSGQAGSTGGQDLEEQGDEETGFANLNNISAGISAQLNHAQNLQEINVGLNSLRKLLADMLHHRKTVIEAKPTLQDEVHPEDRHVYVNMDTGEKKGFFSKHKFLSVVLVLGLIGLGGLKFLEYQDRRETERLNQQLMAMQKQKALQGYEEALGQAKDYSSSELLGLAEQEISKGNMSFSERLLERAIELASVGPEKARAHSLLGYIASREKNLEKAAQAYESSMKSSQKVYLTYHNYAVLKLKMGELADAEKLFLKALQLEEGPKDRSPTILGLVEVALLMDQAENKKLPEKQLPQFSRTNKAATFLGRVSDAYSRERILTEIYIIYLREQGKVDRPKLLEFLKISDEGINAEKTVAGLDMSRIQWSQLYSWCLPLYNSNRMAVHLNAFFSYCVLRSRGPQAAKPYIDFAVQKAPHDPLYKRYNQLVQKALIGGTNDSSQSSNEG